MLACILPASTFYQTQTSSPFHSATCNHCCLAPPRNFFSLWFCARSLFVSLGLSRSTLLFPSGAQVYAVLRCWLTFIPAEDVANESPAPTYLPTYLPTYISTQCDDRFLSVNYCDDKFFLQHCKFRTERTRVQRIGKVQRRTKLTISSS